jgi:hypothetical protein
MADGQRLPGETDLYLEHYEVLGKKIGFNDIVVKLVQIHFPMEAVARQIWSLPCHTISGLKAKALSATFLIGHLWDRPFEELDIDNQALRQLVTAVYAMTGLQEPKTHELPLVEIPDEDNAIGLQGNRDQAKESGDPLFELISRYEQQCFECDNASMIGDGKNIDALFEATVEQTMKKIVDEQPKATTARGAVAAIGTCHE